MLKETFILHLFYFMWNMRTGGRLYLVYDNNMEHNNMSTSVLHNSQIHAKTRD